MADDVYGKYIAVVESVSGSGHCACPDCGDDYCRVTLRLQNGHIVKFKTTEWDDGYLYGQLLKSQESIEITLKPDPIITPTRVEVRRYIADRIGFSDLVAPAAMTSLRVLDGDE